MTGTLFTAGGFTRALVKPPAVNRVPVIFTSLAPPPILNSMSVSGVPEHTV